MSNIWNKHIFTAELPYEKDQIVTLFLKEKFKQVDVFIMSLGQMSNIPPSRLSSYRNGKQIGEKIFSKNNLKSSGIKLYLVLIPKALFYVTADMIRSLKSINFTCDIFFAQHFLPAFLAVVLRKIGILKCEKIVFWMFDFFPIPSEFPRSLYYRGMDLIQGYIRKRVDEIWYTTPRLLECDRERFGNLPKNVKTRLTQGCFFRRIKTKKTSPLPPLRLAFLGSLRRDTAIFESIDVIENCINHNMRVELFVIGSGPEEKNIKRYVERKKLTKAIRFFGFEDRGDVIAKILSNCHLGLSLYPAAPYSPNWFLTSGKFRRYISQQLPVVVSTVPYFAKYIHEYNAGVIVDNDPNEIREKLEKIYHNPSILTNMKRGVDKLYRRYKGDTVLYETFQEMLKTV